MTPDIILTVCLLAAPTECRVERMSFDGSLMACQFAGQFQAAAWVAAHPKWRIARWRCAMPEV